MPPSGLALIGDLLLAGLLNAPQAVVRVDARGLGTVRVHPAIAEQHAPTVFQLPPLAFSVLLPMSSLPVLTWTGPTSGSSRIVIGSTVLFFTTAGTYTCTVTRQCTFTVTGIAGGGFGGSANAASSDQNGGGGGGGGASTTGTVVVFIPGKTYTIFVPTAAASLTLSDGTTTFVSLQGGTNGGDVTGGAGGTAGASTGSNLHSGGAGGNGSIAVSGGTTGGGNQANGAGGGGGGDSADNAGGPQAGGAGRDNPGSAGTGGATGFGGNGGYMFINGTPLGYGGGGANNDNVNDRAGQTGGQGGCQLVA